MAVGPNQHLTQQEMAAMAGTAREVVARSLKTLEEQGHIRMERHRIVVTNRKALEEIVEESSWDKGHIQPSRNPIYYQIYGGMSNWLKCR